MQTINERPVCHRAEDLVTYLYGEAAAEEARDFATHLAQCDACRAEFSVFNQVHESIVTWRNEALVSLAVPQRQTSAATASPVFAAGHIAQHERKLSALAAVREFFSVSPLWLRGATAFAGLLLCALLLFAVSRLWRQPVQVANGGPQQSFNQEEFDRAVRKEVDARLAERARNQRTDAAALAARSTNNNDKPSAEVARRTRPKATHTRLTREETEQLAADLGLIPGREDEQPFVLPDEPNK